MAIEPLRVVKRALSYCGKNLGSRRVIAVDFDEDADILYVKFKHSKIADTEPLDRKGLVAASLDDNKGIVGLIIMEASRFSK
ncbi:MAG: DUF2283 domain-containing protein [Nitrososphaerales archaeon]